MAWGSDLISFGDLEHDCAITGKRRHAGDGRSGGLLPDLEALFSPDPAREQKKSRRRKGELQVMFVFSFEEETKNLGRLLVLNSYKTGALEQRVIFRCKITGYSDISRKHRRR